MKIQWSRIICLPLVMWCVTGAAAQQPPPSIAISLMTSDTQVSTGGGYTQTLHVEMRAGNDAAVAQVGQASAPYDASTQEISIMDAHTHKADGSNIPVEASAIYDQAPSGQQAVSANGQRAKLIVFPQFAAGDTAVYTIKITVQHPSFQNQFFVSEFFPRSLAYEEVRETITAPKSFPLFVESHDMEASKREDGSSVIYSWHYSASNPETDDAVTFSPLEHTPRFFVSSFRDYAELGRAYAALAQPKQAITSKVRELASQVTDGVSDPKEQARKLYEWVSTHIRYVAIELGSGSFTPHDVDAILANGYGDCKDHDLLLRTLLKAKGIEAQSILLNSGDAYFVTEVPTFTTLDHVITFVPQFNLYLDSTAQVAPFGILPMQEYGKPIVVASLATPHAGKMPLLQPGLAKITYKMAASLDKDGGLTASSTTTASGPYAITLRMIGLGIQAMGPTAGTRFLAATGYANASGAFTQASPMGFDPDFTIASTFKATGWSDEVAGKNSFYLPGGMRLFSLSGDGIMGSFSPGKLKPGEPTLCFSASASEDLSLKAPAGVRFNKAPTGLEVKTAHLHFTAQWSLSGDTMSVHREFISMIDQQFCSGDVRTETAAALKTIAESYSTDISFEREDTPEEKAAAALYSTAEAHFQAREFDLAAADYGKIIALLPNEARGYRARGIAMARAHHPEQAIADVSKAVALDPENPGTYYDSGRAHLMVNQAQLAVKDFDKAVALKPDYFDAVSARGAARLFANQYAPAIEDFNKALALQPDSLEVLNSRGEAYYRTQQYALAIADYDKVLAQRPSNSAALLFRGESKIKLGHKAEGELDIMAAEKLDPSLGK